jgi:hypothetical protein
MSTRLLSFTAAVLAGLGTLGGALRAYAQSPPRPQPVDATTLPAHETHQGFTIAVRPLTTEAAYKAQFSGRTPYEAGILALEVFFRNDNDKPVRLTLNSMRLFVGSPGQPPQRIEPLSADQVADRVMLKTAPDPRAPRLPIPGSRTPNSGRDKNWQQFSQRMQAASIPSDVVGPKATVRGFLYFDVAHHYDWLTDARLDVPDLAFMVNNEALFFFQVELAPALR